MRDDSVTLPLAGTVLLDACTDAPVDLGACCGVAVLSLIRHRF